MPHRFPSYPYLSFLLQPETGNLSAWLRYALGIVIVLLLMIVQWIADPYIGNKFLAIFLVLSSLLAAFVGGFGPALMVGVGGVFALGYLFPSPKQEPVDVVGFALYFSIILGTAILGSGMASARRHAQVSSDRLSATLLSIGDGIIVTDVNGHITSMNEVAATLTGWTVEQALNQPLDDIFKIVDQETGLSSQGLVQRVLKSNSVVKLSDHTLLLTKDRLEKHIEDSAAPIRTRRGSVIGCVIVFRDVSERRLALQQLRASESNLRELDARKNTFIAILAHELRNPLAPIITSLEVIQSTDVSLAQSNELIRIVKRQSRQLHSLVEDLLDVSRITNRKFSLTKSRVRLQDVIDQAVETSTPLIEKARHHLSINIQNESIWLQADNHRLAQVISNLLNNAVKFTPDGGQINLTVSRTDKEVSLSVSDNGIGIPKDKIVNIFEMFSQVEHPINRQNGGLGVGLSLTKGIVELHDGTIEVHSEGANQGTNFTIKLPL